jgi:hypothetical protein
MNGISNIVLNEVCWIVQQRNEWAKRRQHYRNKYRYYRNMTADEQVNLDAKYEAVNSERAKLKPYTKRLRSLLRKMEGLLGSDSNAGYDRIVFGLDELMFIKREEIAARAKEYEVDLYMANMFKGRECE